VKNRRNKRKVAANPSESFPNPSLPKQGLEESAKSPTLAQKTFLFSWVVIAFSIGPIIAWWVNSDAKAQFEEVHRLISERVRNLVKDGNMPITLPDGSKILMPVDDSTIRNMREFSSIDAFCESYATTSREMSDACETYSTASKSRIAAIIALALAPLVPILLSMAVVIIRHRKKKGLAASASLWLVIKIANKIAGLESAPLGFALGFAMAMRNVPEVLTVIGSLFVIAMLFGFKAAAIDQYTRGIFELVSERDFGEVMAPKSDQA
jgi:hypothetical protein